MHPPPPLQWKRVKVLGRGSCGTVYLAVFSDFIRDHHELLAMKTCIIDLSFALEKEKRILRNLNGCPEIIRCFGKKLTVERGIGFYNLLLEYAPAGTLKDLINRFSHGHAVMPETNIRIYARMILKGLHHMHRKGYVHCDLKPDNILAFPSTQENDGVYRLKIADFGLTKEPGEVIPSDNKCTKISFRGTPIYMSPESVMLGVIETALDIWSLGCIVIYMATGVPPWHGTSGTRGFVQALAFEEMSPKIPLYFSKSGRDFLSKCFDKDHRRRWSAEMLLKHPYISDVAVEPISEADSSHDRLALPMESESNQPISSQESQLR